MSERRLRTRFPMNLDAHIKCRGFNQLLQITAQTVNISSTGILFSTKILIPPDTEIEAKMDWPGDRPDSRLMFLEIRGRVIRNEGSTIAAVITHHSFRAIERSRPLFNEGARRAVSPAMQITSHKEHLWRAVCAR